MVEGHDTASSPDRARDSSWGGPAVRAELRRLADDARHRAGFQVCSVEVLRGDGFLELVAFTGSEREEAATMGRSYSLSPVHRVIEEGSRYGAFVFLAEEEMDAGLREAISGYGYVPPAVHSDDPEHWRQLDMLVAVLTDAAGATRALVHLDEPLTGRRPRPHELHDLADRLELVLQAVLATVDREELTRRAHLDETARSVVRAASTRLGVDDLLAYVHPALVAGFRARALAVQLYDSTELSPSTSPSDAAAVLPASLRPAVEAATRRAWQSRTVIIVEPGRLWGDDELESEHLHLLTDHLVAHGSGELLLVPVGAGHEPMGVLVVTRDAGAERWTDGESQAALGVGHDLGRALLSTRAHEREQQLIDELQQLDEYRQQLIATVSHELKNPLGVIIGHVEMLDTLPGLPVAATPSLNALGRAASRLISLVDDLLLLSRMNTLADPVARQPIDLEAVVAEVAADAAVHAKQQEVTLRTTPPDGAVRVAGEPDEIHRALANVVGNAVKYSRPGGTVDLSLEGCQGEVVFTCTDEGIGISEKDRDHLFTEFFRSTNREALERPGTGLGLAIVKRIVERHGGSVDVQSRLGVGTTFRMALPAADQVQ